MAEHSFLLPVDYKGDELELEMTLQSSGYASRFVVTIYEHPLIFERDDSGEFRVINYEPDKQPLIDKALFEAVIRSLEMIAPKGQDGKS